MEKWFSLIFMITIASFIFISCSDDSSSTDPINDDPIPGEMVLVEGGTFQMGNHFAKLSSDQLPVHSVTISDFNIGKYEVTQSEWATYMSTLGYYFGEGDNYPAYYVSWYEAIVYCNKRSIAEGLTPCYGINLSTNPNDWGSAPSSSDEDWNQVYCAWNSNGYRLPTEAEWEYASRGGIHWADNYIYSGSDSADQVAWHSSNSTQPIGTKAPNQLGLYDMSGNVEEWCWDWYRSDYYSICDSLGNITNPYGPASSISSISDSYRRITRGGNFTRYYAFYFWNSNRYFGGPGYLECWRASGFRVARTP